MSENIITEKMKRSIYLDYPDYRDNPFTTSNKFGVYIPKLNDRVYEMIEKHEEKLSRRSLLQSQRLGSVQNSKRPLDENIFANSIRTGGHGHDRQIAVEDQGFLPDSHAFNPYQNGQPDIQESPNQFRIRKGSRLDSAYSKDSNTLKKRFHGNRYGYYTNLPYAMVGSSFAGSRFYYDNASRSIENAPSLGRPCSKNQDKKFEDELLIDQRTGQKVQQRSVNPVVSNLLRDSHLRKNQAIQEGIIRLKDTGCLKVPCERIKKNKKVPEKGYVYNDYFTKQSKNGYSRSSGGMEYV